MPRPMSPSAGTTSRLKPYMSEMDGDSDSDSASERAFPDGVRVDESSSLDFSIPIAAAPAEEKSSIAARQVTVVWRDMDLFVRSPCPRAMMDAGHCQTGAAIRGICSQTV
jgi:hypothetical protein